MRCSHAAPFFFGATGRRHSSPFAPPSCCGPRMHCSHVAIFFLSAARVRYPRVAPLKCVALMRHCTSLPRGIVLLLHRSCAALLKCVALVPSCSLLARLACHMVLLLQFGRVVVFEQAGLFRPCSSVARVVNVQCPPWRSINALLSCGAVLLWRCSRALLFVQPLCGAPQKRRAPAPPFVFGATIVWCSSKA